MKVQQQLALPSATSRQHRPGSLVDATADSYHQIPLNQMQQSRNTPKGVIELFETIFTPKGNPRPQVRYSSNGAIAQAALPSSVKFAIENQHDKLFITPPNQQSGSLPVQDYKLNLYQKRQQASFQQVNQSVQSQGQMLHIQEQSKEVSKQLQRHQMFQSLGAQPQRQNILGYQQIAMKENRDQHLQMLTQRTHLQSSRHH